MRDLSLRRIKIADQHKSSPETLLADNLTGFKLLGDEEVAKCWVVIESYHFL